MNKNEIEIGDLCLHYDIPVIVLEKRWIYSSGSTKPGRYSYLCLFYNSADHVSPSSLRKL